jgi:HEAT repeat protein
MRRAIAPLLVLLAALFAVSASAASAPGLHLVAAPGGALDIRDGDALVVRLAPRTPPSRRDPPRLREILVGEHRIAELRIPVPGTSGEEVWIGQIGGSGAAERGPIWSGVTGAKDADGETSQWIEVTSERIVRFDTAETVTRCDGETPRLFPKLYDFATGRWRPMFSPPPPPAGASLVARRRDPAMPTGAPGPDFRWVAASTTRAAGDDPRRLSAPAELNDRDPDNAWMEGLGGDGRGEFLTARATAGGYAVRGLRIFPGNPASLRAFRSDNRVRRLQIAFGPKREQRFEVEIPGYPAADAGHWREPYWVALPKPVAASCVTVILTEVTPGADAAPPRRYGTTAIGELAVFTDADGPDRVSRLVADLTGADDCSRRVPLVVALGPSAIAPLAAAIIAAKGPARECLVEALTTLVPAPADPIVLDALYAAVTGASETQERLLAAAFARAPAQPVAASLGAFLASSRAPLGDRARAARLLGAVDGEGAVAALLTAAGSGGPELRAEIVSALAHARRLSVSALLGALASAPKAPDDAATRAADLLRVLPVAVKRDPSQKPAAVSALRAALAPGNAFELQGRAIEALGALGDGGDPAALAEVRSGSDDPVLRFLATRALGEWKPAGATDVRPALRAALDDRDPGVRETAALGLGKQRDTAATGALMAAAKQEPWPFVRHAELSALGDLCPPGGGDLLIRAVERDVDSVRRAALIALARCKDARARPVFLHVLDKPDENASLRALAAGLLADSHDSSVAPELAAALQRAVAEAEADLAVEGVVVAALRALARLGGADAVGSAVAMAGDAHHPYRAAAVDALGVMCDPNAGRAALAQVAAGADAALARAAAGAERRCGYK